MSLFGAKKTSTFQRAKDRMDKLMSETASLAGTDESSHIGELIKNHKGPLPTDPDGTATTSEVAREELGDYLGLEEQPAAVTLTREQFNQGVRVHNAEVRAEGPRVKSSSQFAERLKLLMNTEIGVRTTYIRSRVILPHYHHH